MSVRFGDLLARLLTFILYRRIETLLVPPFYLLLHHDVVVVVVAGLEVGEHVVKPPVPLRLAAAHAHHHPDKLS